MAKSKSRVSNRVRELRFQHGEMTQQDLARVIGVTRQTIIAVEQGRFCPSLESALRMGRLFKVSVEDMFILDETLDSL
ncbi:MAG: putative transcriptional regulator [Flavobacterium sp.]|jgi:putative transcriptional regulator